MAEFQPAFEFTMQFENNPSNPWSDAPDACPEGYTGPPCRAIAGINSGVYPEAYEAAMSMPQPSRHIPVANFYLTNFWNPMNLAPISSQDLANRVFDEGVNNGQATAVKMLQGVVNSLGGSISIDSHIGPETAAAVNSIAPATMLEAYKQARLARYIHLEHGHPGDMKYAQNWNSRAMA